MEDQEDLKAQLEHLTHEHHELDATIEKMLQEPIVNQIAVQRLKKRKLLLKDLIIQARSKLLPDIIA
jgi:hypothetical protein